MTLSAETTGLLTGLAFSLAVFAFKTATGEFYVLTASSESAGQKRGFLLTATAAYAAVFLLIFLLLSRFPGIHGLLMEHHSLFQAGVLLHLLMAAGFLIWGILLLGKGTGGGGCGHGGGWLLALPCPVCVSAILLTSAFAEQLLPESKWVVRLFVPGIFFLVNFLVLGLLRLLAGKWRMDPRRLAGRMMVFVGLYFAGLLLLIPNFERIEEMYRIVAGTSEFPRMDSRGLLFLPVLFLAGLAFQWKTGNREC